MIKVKVITEFNNQTSSELLKLVGYKVTKEHIYVTLRKDKYFDIYEECKIKILPNYNYFLERSMPEFAGNNAEDREYQYYSETSTTITVVSKIKVEEEGKEGED